MTPYSLDWCDYTWFAWNMSTSGQSFQMNLLGAGGPDFLAVAVRFGTHPFGYEMEVACEYI